MTDYRKLIAALRYCSSHDYSECIGCPRFLSCVDNGDGNERNLMEFAADAIEELQAQMPRWISVDERLPEKNRNYLVYAKIKIGYGVVLNGQGFERWNGREWLVPDKCTVTHWMPLPAPPEEED